ncbi:hypothetical protein H8R18_03420 [Nanchangia anserum]|uniref:Pilus assembly protein TadE n=1 Tax=Nanchangia anserum TaxID=2692125 RepID=A0A8I0G944_9ACTO|nr:hypothetical protein [Nanchangia anserum]MBD3690167.1 hypothetical protein [Nanchangia anserum]QOX82377.1 hypothetical protein H8R18_03420 [Nanchangia anserum]
MTEGRDERGDAVIEFIGVAVVVIIPLVYLILTCAVLQAGTLAVHSGAREAERILRVNPRDVEAASVSAHQILADQGLSSGATVHLECPSGCEGGRIGTVTVTTSVPLPLIPSFIRAVVPTDVSVSAQAAVVFAPEVDP